MEKKPKYKKVTRKADRLLEGRVVARQGKQKDQKLLLIGYYGNKP